MSLRSWFPHTGQSLDSPVYVAYCPIHWKHQKHLDCIRMTHALHGIGILGCGRIAASHAAAIAALPDQAQLIAVADLDRARAESLAQEFAAPSIAGSLGELLELPGIDSVIVCTPNALHAEQTVRALSAGKHVLVEKPMADSVADAKRMACAAEKSNRILAIGHTFRHTPAIRYVQDHRHDFGRLRAVEVSLCVHWDGPQADWWRTRSPGEGLILSLLAPHALDFVQLIVGQDPLTVYCQAARFQSGWQGEDEAMILLRYPAGCLAGVHVSYNQPFVIDRKTLHYENALVRIDNGDELRIDGRLVMGEDTKDAQRMGQKDLHPVFEAQLREFLQAVDGRPNRAVLHDEGVRLTGLLARVMADANRNAAAE